MKAVVDASVAAQWVIAEDRSDNTVLLLDYEQLHAPDHWLAEAVNVVWSKVYKGDLDASDAVERMAVLLRSPKTVTAIATLMTAALPSPSIIRLRSTMPLYRFGAWARNAVCHGRPETDQAFERHTAVQPCDTA
jgi:hypothetical protein